MVDLTESKKLVDEKIEDLLKERVTQEKIISDIKKTIFYTMKNKGIRVEDCIKIASELIILSAIV